MVKVKGTAVKSIADFIKAKFSGEKYEEWLESLPEESKKIFTGLMVSSVWLPLEEAYNIPLKKMCEMFYGGDEAKGGWEAGEYSAEVALNGIYKFFVKLGTPSFILKKASTILPTYYNPSSMEIVESNDNNGTLRINNFEGISVIAENRIGGYIFKALVLSGGENPKVEIKSSLAKGDTYTDYQISWT